MYRTAFRTADVDGLKVFYRDAGPPTRPRSCCCTDFPPPRGCGSRCWTGSPPFRLVAPDYPGFGHSDAPSHTEFAYTFDHLAAVIGRFTEVLGLRRYTLVVQDYGGPVGFRLAIAHPGRLDALVVQNAVAHEDGLGPLWQTRREFWADREAHEAALRENFFSFAATRQRHVGTSPNAENYDPDLWTDEFAFLSRPPAGHPDRPVLRLPHQRRELPRLAGLAPPAPAATAGPMGPLRPVVPSRGGRGLPQGGARRRGAHPQRRPLRPRRAARRDRGPDPGIPGSPDPE